MSGGANRERKNNARRTLKNLSKPFRKMGAKDSKQAREWSKTRKKLKKLYAKELEDAT